MSLNYDKLSFTKEHVEGVAEELKGVLTEDDMFYTIKFPMHDIKVNQTIEHKIEKRASLIKKLEEMQKIDKSIIGESEPVPLTKEKILKAVLKCHRRDFDSVFWKHSASGLVNRERKNVKIRQMYFYLCKQLTDCSLKEIGKIKRQGKNYLLYDHASVIHGIQAHEDTIELYKTDKKLNDLVIKYLNI
mgnify:CR=1 FL=1